MCLNMSTSVTLHLWTPVFRSLHKSTQLLWLNISSFVCRINSAAALIFQPSDWIIYKVNRDLGCSPVACSSPRLSSRLLFQLVRDVGHFYRVFKSFIIGDRKAADPGILHGCWKILHVDTFATKQRHGRLFVPLKDVRRWVLLREGASLGLLSGTVGCLKSCTQHVWYLNLYLTDIFLLRMLVFSLVQFKQGPTMMRQNHSLRFLQTLDVCRT